MKRIEPRPGQESVWDYPRPPRVEPSDKLVEVFFNGSKIAETRRAKRLLETSHPPNYYIPLADIDRSVLQPAEGRTVCEFKGIARYYSLDDGERRSLAAAWSYLDPSPGYEAIRDHLAFYPSRVQACLVDGERVTSQEGDFYGGWITADIVGPFKGGAGTWGW
jgi:uncharacterized protein (DUF427 family)